MSVSKAVSAQLSNLEDASTSQSAKSNGYSTLLAEIQQNSGPNITSDLPAYISSILSEGNLGIVSARPLLSSAVTAISSLPSTEAKIEICSSALASLREKTSTYEEQDTSLRRILASAYQADDEFIQAAKTLEGIALDSSSSSRKYSDWDKVEHWITICRLYIEGDDMLSAETFLNKAKTLRYKITDVELILKFQLSQARILDSKRDFLDASSAYHAVSASPALAEEDRTAALTQAIITSILAPAGPPRSKLLTRLFADDRSANLPEYPILSKMHLDRLVLPEEISAFASKLAPHQLAKTSDGSTVLAKAMVEHNLLAASRLYSNLDFATLGALLGLGSTKAEEYAARMLEQKRIRGSIDQIEGWVVFEEGGAVREWEGAVKGLVEDVERVASLVVQG